MPLDAEELGQLSVRSRARGLLARHIDDPGTLLVLAGLAMQAHEHVNQTRAYVAFGVTVKGNRGQLVKVSACSCSNCEGRVLAEFYEEASMLKLGQLVLSPPQ